jgi:hypothetical protein
MISGRTTVIAHIGYPTETFKAPLIYNPYFEKAGIDAVVVPMGVKTEDYRDFLKSIFRLTNIRGALVTMPHKVTTVGLLDECTTAVKVAGSCNAILRRAECSNIWPNDMSWSIQKPATVWSRSDYKNSVAPARSRCACPISACCRRLSRPRISCSWFRRVRPAGLQLSIPSELSICLSRSANSKSCCGGKSIAAISLLNAGSAKLCGSA